MYTYNELNDDNKLVIKKVVKMIQTFQLRQLDKGLSIEISSNKFGIKIVFAKPSENSRFGCEHKYFDFNTITPQKFEKTTKELKSFLNSNEVEEYHF